MVSLGAVSEPACVRVLAAVRVLRVAAPGHRGRGPAGARRAALPARAPHVGPAGARAHHAAAARGQGTRRRRRRSRQDQLAAPRSYIYTIHILAISLLLRPHFAL